MRCMEHTIYLAAGDFIKTIGPKKMRNKGQTALNEDDGEEEYDKTWAADWNQLELVPDEEAIDEEIDFDAGDTLGKALALITQVSLSLIFRFLPHFYFIFQIRASPQARTFFAKCCQEEAIAELELIKWVRTRWGSMHDLVDRLIECKKVFISSTSRIKHH